MNAIVESIKGITDLYLLEYITSFFLADCFEHHEQCNVQKTPTWV